MAALAADTTDDKYLQMAAKAEKYDAPGLNVELECRLTIPTPREWKDYETISIPYFRLLSNPTLNVRKVGHVIETKELVEKVTVGNVAIHLSIEKQYPGRIADIMVPHITRYIQRKTIGKDPLTVITYENGVFALEVEYNRETVAKCKDIINSYMLPMWPTAKPADAHASDFISNILRGKYCISVKADGEHVLVYACQDSWFYITDSGCIEGDRFFEEPDTIMEGELINKDEIYVYDVLRANAKDIRSETLSKRREQFRAVSPALRLKDIYPFSTYNGLVKAYKKCASSALWPPTPTDGIIMTSMGPYHDVVFKSKPIPTVDLQYVDGYLYLANEKSSNRMPAGNVHFENGKIYEFDMKMNYIRAREDKNAPNTKMPVEVDPLTNIVNGYGIPSLRYHHNYVKTLMLKLLPKTVLLDVGSGYGGDIDKWDRFEKVYAVDPELKLRSTPKNVVPLRCRAQDIPDIKYESVSMFFVPWDIDILNVVVPEYVKVVMMIVMGDPKPISNHLYTIEVGDDIRVNIPGTATAENIVENRISTDEIDRFMESNNYECVEIDYGMKFGSPEEIALSKMYKYLCYKRKRV